MRILLANLTKMVDDTGGLAKVTCSFANAMLKYGHEVFLVYSDEREGNFFFKIDDKVHIYDLRHFNGQSINFPLALKLKREIFRVVDDRRARTVNDDFAEKYLKENLMAIIDEVKPEVIIAFQPASSKLLLCDLNVNIPVITMSHGDPEDYFHTYPLKELPALEKSAVCQVLLPSFAENLKRHLPNLNTIVIGNAVPQYEQSAKLGAKKDNYIVITIGRLVKNHKRPHLLIEAFRSIAEKFPNWQLEIWGAKDKKVYYRELENIIKKANLQDRIFLKGVTNDVESVLKRGDLFVFPSAYEGFGLSLAEAMSMGLPSIGYKSCVAINELITDSVNGFLCEDGIEPLANKMAELMRDQQLRCKMGQAARDSMRRYSPDNIWNQWNNLIESFK